MFCAPTNKFDFRIVPIGQRQGGFPGPPGTQRKLRAMASLFVLSVSQP